MPAPAAPYTDPVSNLEDRQREAEEAQRAQREAERQARDQATRTNLELGRGVFASLTRVRVDERTLKLLSSVDVTGQLSGVAMRGARYCLPGWVTETTRKNGSIKYGYLDRAECQQRATQFLQAATKTAEIAGRQLALVMLAVYADENATAQSNRSWHHITPKGPWAAEFEEMLDALATDKLPAATLAILAPFLQQRAQQRQQHAAERETREQAATRLHGIENRLAELTIEQIDQAAHDLDTACVGWTPKYSPLRQQLAARRAELADDTSEQ